MSEIKKKYFWMTDNKKKKKTKTKSKTKSKANKQKTTKTATGFTLGSCFQNYRAPSRPADM